ncbi:hypothetical protein OU798_20660 [Prolixibacteraceae bacterium Z1-6]|uniref:Alpha-galactosidase n=1 Tax=Draconibacterium aestuarii TaxID=2998507 RepID=A0A9X3J6L1_9BACT|nr:hypothetical protein [Prolixibacteraceae bacterium Z1-6]
MRKPVKHLFALILVLSVLLFISNQLTAQEYLDDLRSLPIISESYTEGIKKDWLIQKPAETAQVFRNENNELILSNGIISRSFRLSPNAATTSLKVLSKQEEHIRAIKPEAVLSINGFTINVGGLTGQPNLAFLYPDWLDNLESDPLSFQFTGFKIGTPEKRFEWKQERHHAPNAEWPPKGVKLQMNYKFNAIDPEELIAVAQDSKMGRKVLFSDDFSTMSDVWEIRTSPAHERSSFYNEGKPGEIYTSNNTAVYAEYKLPAGTGLVETSIDAGTDLSGFWGPGIALVWEDRIVKFNMRPGNESGIKNTDAWHFTVFDGTKENTRAGGKEKVDFSGTWIFRLRIDGTKVFCEAKPKDGKWKTYESIDFGRAIPDPISVRIGKLGRNASGEDHEYPGELVRLKMNSFAAYGTINQDEIEKLNSNLNDLQNLAVSVNYELYDGVPVLSKWVSIQNNSNKPVKIDHIISEYLGIADHNPYGDYREREDLKVKPNIHFETDYAFAAMAAKVANKQTVHWESDQEYVTQISWVQDIPNTMRIFPDKGYHSQVAAGESFESIRTFIIPFDSYDKERNGLAHRKMYRIVAPWVTENPMMFHITSSKWDDYVNGVNQAAEVGYEMVNFSFGSGFNPEDESPQNYEQMKKYAAYADSKGIKIGTYSLLASRRISEKDDVVNPKTGKTGGFATFGNSPCLESEWGQEYFRKMYRMFSETGFKTFTHDGNYPGDVCASENHPGHEGLGDSQYKQWKKITDFYKWCKSQGIYLRVPDYYYLSGSNQNGVGYRENNWSLPRRHQLIHTRQNIYDGTWESTPSMRWSFIPLAQYHGGGEAATIEPLHDHLDHYEMMLVSNIGMGIQSAVRGPRLYDTPETKLMVKRVVAWYKKYRNILESDIVHLRRADGRDIDYMMHINPKLKEKGFLLVFNPTDNVIRKKITVPLYYTGLTDVAQIREQEHTAKTFKLNRAYEIEMEVEVQPNGYNWFVIE